MSTSAHRANLARIRENQRRSRARRREYLQELEQRLRLCELQGVEASAEVQLAARRVAEENKQLRDLLNRYGLGDEHIEHFLQAGVVPIAEQTTAQHYTVGNPGLAVQSLEQLIVPRRPTCLEKGATLPATGQTSRESSTVSVSTSPTQWESTQVIGYSYCPPSRPAEGVRPVAAAAQALSQPYTPSSGVSDTSTPRVESFTSHPANLPFGASFQSDFGHSFMPLNHHSAAEFKDAITYTNHHHHHPLVTNCGSPGCFCG